MLYRNQNEHSLDCDRFSFEAIPRRIFLDTNIVDCLVKWGPYIFERVEPPNLLDHTLRDDIESLMHIFFIGSRANWDTVISNKTLEELSQTQNDKLREKLLDYGSDLAAYCDGNFGRGDERYARDLARRLQDSQFLASLRDTNDRDLIAHAIAFECDVFCTRESPIDPSQMSFFADSSFENLDASRMVATCQTLGCALVLKRSTNEDQNVYVLAIVCSIHRVSVWSFSRRAS